MRIAIFTFSYAPFMTGIATGVHTRVKALLDLGHEILLIHPAADAQFAEETRQRKMAGLEEVADHPRFQSTAYPTKPHLMQPDHPEPLSHRKWSDTELLKAFQPDVIVVAEAAGMCGFSSLFWGGYRRAVGTEYSKLTGVPAVVLFETDWLSYAVRHFGRLLAAVIRRLLIPINKRFSQKYACTYFHSEVLMKRYRENGLHPSEYLRFHGVDCERFKSSNVALSPIPENGRPVLLFVGRMVQEKSIDELIRVVEIVRVEVPHVQMVFVGGGPAGPKIRQLAEQHPDHCTYWGEAFGNPLLGLYARAQVFLNPSASEAFCTTNLEAMASGTPVVAAGSGGNLEQVVDDVNGYLVTPHDPAAMAQRVIQILKSPALQQKLSQGARDTGMEFDIRTCARHLEQALQGLVDRAAVAGTTSNRVAQEPAIEPQH